jgi:Secretion system C-terminal sorting domain
MKYKSLLRINFSLAFLIMTSQAVFAQLSPLTIGTIHAGDSVVIIYAVTINTGLPPGTTHIANQGTIAGGNFISIVTDDPDTATPDDSTITLLNTSAVPVTFGGIRAYQKNNDIEIAWKILTEINTLKYEVEKSANGSTFTKIGEVAARGGFGTINYTFLDINPFTGNNYYRLKVIDIDGSVKYSTIVRVVINNSGQLIAVYPNPVTAMMVNLQFTNIKRGRYLLNLYNGVGQIVYTSNIDHAGGSASQLIILPSTLGRGLYSIELKGENVRFNKKLIVH